eukprot:5731783-Pleurochrysis_carterae.AAC.2
MCVLLALPLLTQRQDLLPQQPKRAATLLKTKCADRGDARTMISSSATCRAGCIGVICGCIGVPMVCAMVAAIAAGIAFGSETGSPACMRAAAWMLCALCIGGSIAPPSGTIAAPAAPIDACDEHATCARETKDATCDAFGGEEHARIRSKAAHARSSWQRVGHW